MQKFLRTFKISLLTAFMVLSLASSESSLAAKREGNSEDEPAARESASAPLLRRAGEGMGETGLDGDGAQDGCVRRYWGREHDALRSVFWAGLGGLMASSAWALDTWLERPGRGWYCWYSDRQEYLNQSVCKYWGGEGNGVTYCCQGNNEGPYGVRPELVVEPLVLALVAVGSLSALTVTTSAYLCCAHSVGANKRVQR